MHMQCKLFLIIFLVPVQLSISNASCVNDRKIFTSKQGTIDTSYGNNQRCEYLIRGEPNEYITLHIHSFHLECTYDNVFVHDGASRSSKLLAVLTGKHEGRTLLSSSHEVFILLQADSIVTTRGLNLTYNIYPCSNNCSNHGTCINHICKCDDNRYGNACQLEWCPNHPKFCSGYPEQGHCEATLKSCSCKPGFYGESCSLSNIPNRNLNSWQNISVSSNVYESRAGHVSVYNERLDILLIHGGYSFNGIFSDIVIFNFTLNKWIKPKINGKQPRARFWHTSIFYKENLLIFGGELDDGVYSNELWTFNCLNYSWQELNVNHLTLGLKLHTMNLVMKKDENGIDNPTLYVFGGQDYNNSLISSKIFIYDINKNSWSIDQHFYGKELSLRVYGHSSIFYEALRSLFIFGGFHSTYSLKPGNVTNRILLYHVDNHIWSILEDFENSEQPPPPLGYHTAVSSGRYMIIFGGITFDDEKNTCPMSSKIYYYNLRCNVWVKKDALFGAQIENKWEPKYRFSHSAIIKDKQTMIIANGFDQFQILDDVIAYRLPESIVYLDNSTHNEVYGSRCWHYSTKDNCIKDPSCSYCNGKEIPCVAYTKSSNCESSCDGICRHFTSCETCTGQTIVGSDDGYCQWCTLDRTCYHSTMKKCQLTREDEYGCDMTQAGVTATWWQSKGGLVVQEGRDCQLHDNRTGLHMLQYFHKTKKPNKFDQPDGVKVLRSTLDIEKQVGMLKLDQTIIIKGLIFPFICYNNPKKCYHHMNITPSDSTGTYLELSDTHWRKNLNMRKVAGEGIRPYNESIFPLPSTHHSNPLTLSYIMKLTAKIKLNSNSFRKLGISWNHTNHHNKPEFHQITANYLQLYQLGLGACSKYSSCMGCITDAMCGWKDKTNECLYLEKYWKDEVEARFLAREESQCVKCDDYFDCTTCLKREGNCVWEKYNGCKRKDHSIAMYVFTDIKQCLECNYFNNSNDCVQKGVGCLWCTQKDICISHHEYHLHNQFGQCYDIQQIKKVVCASQNSCSSCINQYRCGWLYNASDPSKGQCIEGDFSRPYVSTNVSSTHDYNWSYSRCNECKLRTAKCKNNSKCINTDSSYECKCNEGFEGDGKVECKKICLPKCVHGTCTKEIMCQCDLGWKEVDCSIDCGCHNHSTCFNGTCDFCQNFTTGYHCEYCVPGSYGNATTEIGCKNCNCNHHGDKRRNICDINDGSCYCVDNTVGRHCEKCLPNFSHPPTDYKYPSHPGGICHLNCKRSLIHLVNSSGWLVASHENNKAPYITCLWVLTASNVSHDSLIYNQTQLDNSILLRLHKLKASCSDSHLNIYDGVPPNPRTEKMSMNSNFKLLNSVCDLNSNNNVYRSRTGILSLFYEGRTSLKRDGLPSFEPLNELLAEYTLLACPDNCPPPFNCSAAMKCGCKDGLFGTMCEKIKCKNGCYKNMSGGFCDEVTYECVCNHGFFGDDCSNKITVDRFSLEIINVQFKNLNKNGLERLGSSMVCYKNVLYVFGGSHFKRRIEQSIFTKFDISRKLWEQIEIHQPHPGHRYAHCSFVLNGFMYIYGGIAKNSNIKDSQVLNDFWRYDISNNMWENIRNLSNLKQLAGHSCTLVNQSVYILGGYSPEIGLNEDVVVLNFVLQEYNFTKINLTKIDFEKGKPKPTGMFSHVAIYDPEFHDIYFHGGMAFYEEKIQPSHRIYVLNIKRGSWNHFANTSSDHVPTLVGHTGHLISDSLYLFGGYNDRVTFNNHVYILKKKHNIWSKLDNFEGNGKTNQMFLSSVNVGRKVYIFGGFNSHVSSNIKVFSIPSDICSHHKTNTMCLNDVCSWCNGKDNGKGFCFDGDKPSVCGNESSISVNTDIISNKRKCSSYQSCLSCLSTHSFTEDQCQWCRCSQESGVCRSMNEKCNCKKYVSLNKCWEVFCETSSCSNCKDQCFWTGHLKYKSESKRILNKQGLEFNCFLNSLALYLPSGSIFYQNGNCPLGCYAHTTCSSCLRDGVTGVYAGTKYCLWSDKLSECLSIPLLPILCSFGHCGQLFSPNMRHACPAPCETIQTCLACTRTIGCGWCEQADSKKSRCMKGDLNGPLHSTCGITGQHFLPSIVSVHDSPPTWAYTSCPLKDECLEKVDNCNNETEICKDVEEGFTCLCQDGYEKKDGKCVPVCETCVHGKCTKPKVCSCSFSWTGENCTVPCECNNHSNCINSTLTKVCIKCFNNSQGKHCEECKPFFVNSSSTCNSCKSYCHGNADFCVTRDEYEIYKTNHSILETIKKGLAERDDVVCINCTNYSVGDHCTSCIDGYFKDRMAGENCTKCRCNGHGNICNRDNGGDCKCLHNTYTDTGACQSAQCRYIPQCAKCKQGFFGDPKENRQCYKHLSVGPGRKDNPTQPEHFGLDPDRTVYFNFMPPYSNIDVKVIIDVYEGEVDVYVAGTNINILMMEDDNRVQTLTFKNGVDLSNNITTPIPIQFSEYNGSKEILRVFGIQHRLVIYFPYEKHNYFADRRYFVVVSSINKTKVDASLSCRQEYIAINAISLVLSMVFAVIFVFTSLCMAYKCREDYARVQRGIQESRHHDSLSKRPFASYRIVCERNESINIIRKRKDRNTSGKNKSLNNSQNNNNHKRITPLTIQNTEDCLASVITVMVQFPANELSSWNLNLASGLFQTNNQHLVQVKSQVTHGRKVDTRILTTQT